jgi:hypothetical protein
LQIASPDVASKQRIYRTHLRRFGKMVEELDPEKTECDDDENFGEVTFVSVYANIPTHDEGS